MTADDLVTDTGVEALDSLRVDDGDLDRDRRSVSFCSSTYSSVSDNSRTESSIGVVEEDDIQQEALLGEDIAVVYVELLDGSFENEDLVDWGTPSMSQTRISVEGIQDENQLVMIRLSTQHHAFSLKRSTVTRSIRCFYRLQSILKEHYPWSSVPGLPLRPTLWVSSIKWRNEQLANFLRTILSNNQFLSSRALHLFLQTGLSMEKVRDNLEGKRDDEVIVDKSILLRDTRTNSKEGFSSVFGSGS